MLRILYKSIRDNPLGSRTSLSLLPFSSETRLSVFKYTVQQCVKMGKKVVNA